MGRLFAGCLLAALLLALAPDLGLTQNDADLADIDARTAAWSKRLDALSDRDADAEGLLDAIGEAQRIEQEAAEASEQIRDRLAPLQREIDALGAPPDDGSPERPSTARMRSRLEDEAAIFEEASGTTVAIAARAEALADELRALERERLQTHLFRRGPSPLNPLVWPQALAGLQTVVGETFAATDGWWSSGAPATRGIAPFVWPLLAALFGLIAGMPVATWLRRAFGRDPAIEEPDAGRRLMAATALSVATAAPPCFALLAALAVMAELELVTGAMAAILSAVVGSIVLLILLPALAFAGFPDDAPRWRLIPIDDERTRTARARLLALAVFLAVTGFVLPLTRGAAARSPELQAVIAALLTVPLAGLLLLLSPRRLWHLEDPDDKTSIWDTLRFGAGAAAAVMLVAALGGWAHLAHAVSQTVILSGLALLTFTIARTLVDALLVFGLSPESPSSSSLRDFVGLEKRGATVAVFWLSLLLDAALAFGTAILWALALGLPWSTLSGWMASAARGIRIGSFRISFADVLFAGIAFTGVLAVARLIRHTLDQRVFPQTNLGPGVQNSLNAAVRYLGLAIAAAVGISMLGLDLSNLALVAGALSVGIGFGLQNVVSNFVSGIIMLVERPVKVGDWVVLGGNEGIVKRINVRATEIETFSRSAVIIPNSEILASPIINWTHRDSEGRLEITVGVAYGSDVQKVRELLLACAKAHDQVASYPAPVVLFRDFGGSSLDFELRAFMRNNQSRLTVMSDLRFAIDAAFREHDIEIPFSQHDIHLRDIDRLDEILRGRPPRDDDA